MSVAAFDCTTAGVSSIINDAGGAAKQPAWPQLVPPENIKNLSGNWLRMHTQAAWSTILATGGKIRRPRRDHEKAAT